MVPGPSCSHHDRNPQILWEASGPSQRLVSLQGASWERRALSRLLWGDRLGQGSWGHWLSWRLLRWKFLPESGRGRQRSPVLTALPSPSSAPCSTRGQAPQAPGPRRTNRPPCCVFRKAQPSPGHTGPCSLRFRTLTEGPQGALQAPGCWASKQLVCGV